jgi:hypothetical protein
VTVIGMALMIPADLGFEVWITTRPVTGRGDAAKFRTDSSVSHVASLA